MSALEPERLAKRVPRRARERSLKKRQRRTTMYATATGAVVMLPTIAPLSWRQQRSKLLAVGVVGLLIAALFSFFNLDQFYVYGVKANGLHFLTQEEVGKASGALGFNIFFVESGMIERALAKLPEVKSVQVSPSLPNQLMITIQERQPQYTWVSGSQAYWVDSEGVVLHARKNLDLVTVRDLSSSTLKPGEKVSERAIQALEALRKAWREAPRALEWSDGRGLGFTNQVGWKVYLGDASDMVGKTFRYHVVMAQLLTQGAKIQYIDLGRGDPFYQ